MQVNKTRHYGRITISKIKFKLRHGAKLPVRGSEKAAGLDIHSLDDLVVPARGRVLVTTGVFLADCQEFMYLRVAPRSKLAFKFGIDTLAGVVDCDYRGEIGVILYNTSDTDYPVCAGDAIAQLIPESIMAYEPVEVDDNYVSVTDRGEEGIYSEDLRC